MAATRTLETVLRLQGQDSLICIVATLGVHRRYLWSQSHGKWPRKIDLPMTSGALPEGQSDEEKRPLDLEYTWHSAHLMAVVLLRRQKGKGALRKGVDFSYYCGW